LQHEAFPGEDVDRLNQLIRGTICRLDMIKAVPHDIFRVIYQTSTTPEFAAKFQLLSNLNELGQTTSVQNYSALLAKGEEEYRALNACDMWCAASTRKAKKSAFVADPAKPPAAIKPPSVDAKEKGKDKVDKYRIPPKEGEAQKRTFKNADGTSTDRWWCSRCNIWSKTHATAEHRTKAEIATAAATPSPTINVAIAASDPQVDAKSTARIIAAAHAAHALMSGLLQPSI
jgi:hypothetical protein